MKKVLVVKEGKFYTGWKVNTDFAFEDEKDLHEHMEKVNGFKCVLSNDTYSQNDTRFKNKEKEYGYDVITLEIKEAVVEDIFGATPPPIKKAKVIKEGSKVE